MAVGGVAEGREDPQAKKQKPYLPFVYLLLRDLTTNEQTNRYYNVR